MSASTPNCALPWDGVKDWIDGRLLGFHNPATGNYVDLSSVTNSVGDSHRPFVCYLRNQYPIGLMRLGQRYLQDEIDMLKLQVDHKKLSKSDPLKEHKGYLKGMVERHFKEKWDCQACAVRQQCGTCVVGTVRPDETYERAYEGAMRGVQKLQYDREIEERA